MKLFRWLMFMISVLPIVLVFLLPGLLVARTAKKRGKNPWLWGGLTFVLIMALAWQQIPKWAAHIAYRGLSMINSTTSKEKIITLAEAKNIDLRSTLDGVHFDVPLVYEYRGYNQQLRGWPGVSKGQIEGKERTVVDFVEIDALLPDISPMTEENLAKFVVVGWGLKTHASLTHMKPWDYYFKHFFKMAQRKPDLSELPGMMHYYEHGSDVFFSHDYPTDDLTRIRCDDQKLSHAVYPSCQVETFYRPAPDLVAANHIEGAVFRLEYRLAPQYLGQWREIDRKIKFMFDQFIKKASEH